MSANLKRLPALALAFGLALSAFPAVAASYPPRLEPGIVQESPQVTPYVLNRVLAANVAETVTVPAACDIIIFGATPPVFYLRADGQPAAIPAADVNDGTGSAISPSVRRFVPAQTFSVIAPEATKLSMECYDYPNDSVFDTGISGD